MYFWFNHSNHNALSSQQILCNSPYSGMTFLQKQSNIYKTQSSSLNNCVIDTQIRPEDSCAISSNCDDEFAPDTKLALILLMFYLYK